MPDERFREHLEHPLGRGHQPVAAPGLAVASGQAGGSLCGDLVVVRLALDPDGIHVADAGFDAEGCGALTAAASAAVDRLRGVRVLEAARLRPADLSDDLGGLSVGSHAADLVADAVHMALGAAVRDGAGLPDDPDRTLVAMSGGVDSAVAALRCAASGPAVAVTVELWRDPENDAEASCCSASAVRRARAMAHDLGLAHLTLDLRAEFRAGVVDPWLADHAAGLTPNPCVRCNGHVRLDAMLDLAARLGCGGGLATGHYARVTEDGLLRAALDERKDQAYMLARLDPASIARLRFPLGELRKPEVRALAEEAGLPVARQADSQDLCFLAGTGRARFLERHGGLGRRPGAILDERGERVGTHDGAHQYTVGQRRGLGGGWTDVKYVTATDVEQNVVRIGPAAALARDDVLLRDVALHRPAAEVDAVRLRYRSRPVACRVEGDRVVLDEPVAGGVAPGQLACLLRGDVVVGAATIA